MATDGQSEIIQVKRRPTIKFVDVPPEGLKSRKQSEEMTSVVFHIADIEGLSSKKLSGIYVTLNSSLGQSYNTEPKKYNPGVTAWNENIEKMDVSNKASVWFEIRQEGSVMQLKRGRILGYTDSYDIQKLLDMQKAVGDSRDALISLAINLNPLPVPSPNADGGPTSKTHSRRNSVLSPPPPASSTGNAFLHVPSPASPIVSPGNSPRPSFSSATSGSSGSHSRSQSISWGGRSRSGSTAPSSVAGDSTHSSSNSSTFAFLRINIRDTPMNPQNNKRLLAPKASNLMQSMRGGALQHIAALSEKVDALDSEDGQTLIKMVQGELDNLRGLFSRESGTVYVSGNTVALIDEIENALEPFTKVSAKKMGKRRDAGPSSARECQSLDELLRNTIKALNHLDAFSRSEISGPNSDGGMVRDKLELKIGVWIKYFAIFATLTSTTEEEEPKAEKVQPIAVNSRGSGRLSCPQPMGATPGLPRLNMLQMSLPEASPWSRPDVVRHISEWVFSQSYHPNTNALSGLGSVRLRPSSKRPAELKLVEPNGLDGLGGAAIKNVFCLSGPPASGKTAVAAQLSEGLNKLGCLGGYFSFDPSSSTATPIQLIESLPITLIHQACAVEPDLVPSVSIAFGAKSAAVSNDTLESKLENLFAAPVRKHLAEGNAKWNAIDPLVFVIDGIGTIGSIPTQDADVDAVMAAHLDEIQRVSDRFVDFITSKSVQRLPAYFKFLVVARGEEGGVGVDAMLRRRGATFGYDLASEFGKRAGGGSASGLGSPSGSMQSFERTESPLPLSEEEGGSSGSAKEKMLL